MNAQLLQKIDRHVGVPLCFFLTAFRKAFGRRWDGRAVPRRILFVKLAEQGSTVLAVPAIRRAVELVGRENVYFVVFDENRFILDLLELIPQENVVTICANGLPRLAFSAVQAIARLRKLRFDAAVDLEFFSRGSAAITFFTGARTRVGFHAFFGGGPYRGDLMTHRLNYNSRLHTATTFRVLTDALTQDPANLPRLDPAPLEPHIDFPAFIPRPGEVASVRALLGAPNAAWMPMILLNPNASDLLPLRQWPRERYIELAARLLEELPEAQIVFTGGPGEAQAIEQVARQVNHQRCCSLAGKTTLRQLMVLYTLSEILVTNDSGPAHFAALTPIHVVSLFGPETPALFSAPSSRNLPLWAGLPCSPCVTAYNNRQSTCQDNQCMKQISVGQVAAEVRRIFSERQSLKTV